MKKQKKLTVKKKIGIYIHIPFCIRKCGYCDFCSVPYDEKLAERYFNAVKRQMEEYRLQLQEYKVDTIYFGGGTPTVPHVKYLCGLIKQMQKLFCVSKTVEITVEANPASDLKKTLRKLHFAGVNRLSIGLQSMQDSELAALGRLHDRAQFETAYKEALAAGFDNISVDLMFGIPGQDISSWEDTLDQVLALTPPPQHISCYGLKIEEGTPFFEKKENLPLPDEDAEADMYEGSGRKLREAGYRHYEISNFAQRNFESKHNLKYWECEEYLGFGVAAASYFGNHRFTAVRDIEAYIAAIETSQSCFAEISDEPYAAVFGDYIMLHLRLQSGISCSRFQSRFRREIRPLFEGKLQKYVENGLMEDDGKSIRLTEKGFYISNYILADLLNF